MQCLLPIGVNAQNGNRDTPSDSNFIRRGYERGRSTCSLNHITPLQSVALACSSLTNHFIPELTATVIGTTLYLSGGEISQYSTTTSASGGGLKLPPSDRPSTGISSTLSLDLSVSWNARTAPFQAQTFANNGSRPPVVGHHALWPWRKPSSDNKEEDEEGFYIYGGQVTWDDTVKNVPKNRGGVWKFTGPTKGQAGGGGVWSVEQASNPDTLKGFNVAYSMAYAAGNGRGWSIGGIMNRASDPDYPPNSTAQRLWVPGMVEYEFETRKWTNHTEVGFLRADEALQGGRAHFVDGLLEKDGKEGGGHGGVVMVLGGGVFPVEAGIRPAHLLDFMNVTFFDAETKRWYSQTTSGTPPTGRMGHCVAGVRSQAGTHEMYVCFMSPLQSTSVRLLMIPSLIPIASCTVAPITSQTLGLPNPTMTSTFSRFPDSSGSALTIVQTVLIPTGLAPW